MFLITSFLRMCVKKPAKFILYMIIVPDAAGSIFIAMRDTEANEEPDGQNP